MRLDKMVWSGAGIMSKMLVGLVMFFSTAVLASTESDASMNELLSRIQPVGTVATSKEEAQLANPVIEEVAVPSGPMSGEQVYSTACFVCHASGVAGAPKLGDSADWGVRLAQGKEVLFKHATEGFKGMPARGGSSRLSDDEVRGAINYMLENSQ